MKLEIDLLSLDTEIGIRAGRRAAVLLLATLPEDEARLAMQQWAVWREAEEEAADVFRQEGAVNQQLEIVGRSDAGETPVQVVETHPQTEPEPTIVQIAEEAPPPRKPTYEKFAYGGDSFSVKKTGPSAALRRAFADILGADRVELEKLHPKLNGLKGVFVEIGREDLAAQVDEALGKRMAELPGVPSEQAEPQAEPQQQPAAEPAPPAPPAPSGQQAQQGMVEWEGKRARPAVARSVALQRIATCAEMEQLDLITDPIDKLADQLEDLGQVGYANEIRTALTARTDALVAQEDQPAAEQRAGPPTPRTAPASNGSEEPPTLRQLMRKVEHELGIRKAKELMTATAGKKTELGQLTEAEASALQAAASAALAG